MGKNLTSELRKVQFSSYGDIFQRFQSLSAEYGGMSAERMIAAFGRATGSAYHSNNPYIQNRRVKQISSLPQDYTKDDVAQMITAPDGNELPLRQVEKGLEYTAYPMFHIRKVYQDLLTYHSYIAPQFLEKEDAKNKEFWREWRLLEKLRYALAPETQAHQAAGQALQEGKVFYYPRISVDKVHNCVNHAFLQQLPSDWTKIVGLNNVSKYTVAFNMFYFLQPGTDVRQFGDLFLPYIDQFGALVSPGSAPKGVGKRIVYAAKASVDFAKLEKMREDGALNGNPDVYYQNGTWFYWVTLPVDKVFPFEIDDTNRNVVPPFTGLFLSMIQLAQYEQIQLELVQNPLISLVTGEIPYRDDKDASTSDPYKLSNAGRRLFESLWYQMLADSNTSGIGLFMAPLENMTMHTLAEAPSAMEISSNGYGYTMAKAGLAGIIPTSDDPKSGTAQISLKIESRFATGIYRCFERMMKSIIQNLKLRYDWTFVMFGDVATDEKLEEEAKAGMTMGLLPNVLVYNALHDRSIFDDMSISFAIQESGIMDARLPLVTSYSAKNPDSNLPPKSDGQQPQSTLSPEAAHQLNPGGRPSAEGEATSDGQEKDIDTYGE